MWIFMIAVLFLSLGCHATGKVASPCEELTFSAAKSSDEETAAASSPASKKESVEKNRSSELVVLIHGMGRSPRSLSSMSRYLSKKGYRTVLFGYSSFFSDARVREIGKQLAKTVAHESKGSDVARVHFVGHSLGNIVIRWLLANNYPRKLGRVVMLAPPNRGSKMADGFAPLFGWLLPALRDLRTDPRSTAQALTTPEGVEIGVIAGKRDRKVSVRESHLEGEKDHAIVDSSHTFLMSRKDVQELTHCFLNTGWFHEPEEP